ILLPIGVYIGLQIFQNMDSDNIKNIIGIFILLALTLQNLKFIKSFFVPYYAFYFIGLITGVLNILVGVIAPLLAVILKQSISEKKSIVGTLGYFGLIGNY
ncbi:hypothetical protein N9L98_02010, partial [bacterium]|nr:hypothetical protein [bacterium]